ADLEDRDAEGSAIRIDERGSRAAHHPLRACFAVQFPKTGKYRCRFGGVIERIGWFPVAARGTHESGKNIGVIAEGAGSLEHDMAAVRHVAALERVVLTAHEMNAALPAPAVAAFAA